MSKVYEDDRVLAFLDIHPVSTGHTLVIPKDMNCRTVLDISREDWLAMAAAVHKIAPAIERAMQSDGINLMMNNREHAGQVVDHPHIHIVPRYKGDGLRLWPHGSYEEGKAQEVQQKILAELK